MTLTDQQIAFFHTFGYLSFPGLMADCIEEITHAFERVWERHGGGKDGRPHDHTVRWVELYFTGLELLPATIEGLRF